MINTEEECTYQACKTAMREYEQVLPTIHPVYLYLTFDLQLFSKTGVMTDPLEVNGIFPIESGWIFFH